MPCWPKKEPQHTILVRFSKVGDDADHLFLPLTIGENPTQIELNQSVNTLLERIGRDRFEVKSVYCAWVGFENEGSTVKGKEAPRTCLIEAMKAGDDNLVQDTVRLMSKRKWRDYLRVEYGKREGATPALMKGAAPALVKGAASWVAPESAKEHRLIPGWD